MYVYAKTVMCTLWDCVLGLPTSTGEIVEILARVDRLVHVIEHECCQLNTALRGADCGGGGGCGCDGGRRGDGVR